MSKLPALRPKHVVQVLERAGFMFVRQKGSHRMYIKGAIGVIVPMHNKDLKTPTLRNIIKQSGMKVEEFVGLL